VVGGGIIPEEDKSQLLKAGVSALFDPGAETDEIVRILRELHTRKVSV